MSEPDDEETVFDSPPDSLVRMAGKILHEDSIRKLMQSLQSDTFTTEQYRQYVDSDLKSRMPLPFDYPTEYARNCLVGYGVMKEVGPDIWGLLT